LQFESDPRYESFRTEVRKQIAALLPPELAKRERYAPFSSRSDDQLRWVQILHEAKNWSVPGWPVDLGGTGWDPVERFIFDEECYLADAPPIPWNGLHMVGPVIYTFGSEELKRRFLPAIREGLFHWAQGFSEPSAGSDLASLRTRAVRDGDHYVVNGQKIWTSRAHDARWGFFLVRTDTEAKPQEGISFLLIDLESPGITIRPIQQFDGNAHVNEVFLNDVRVPVENLVGEEGAGWSYGKFLLERERTASAFIFRNKRELCCARVLAAGRPWRDGTWLDEPNFAARLARAEAQIDALEWSVRRVLANEESPYPASAIASTLKIRGSELQQITTELQLDALGLKALRFIPPKQYHSLPEPGDTYWPEDISGRTASALFARVSTIYGGSIQVQKTLIAKLAFGL
jgi:alkylation response protein AidB-like acyl-CoA dehydrogenase